MYKYIGMEKLLEIQVYSKIVEIPAIGNVRIPFKTICIGNSLDLLRITISEEAW